MNHSALSSRGAPGVMGQGPRMISDLETLVHLFYAEPEKLGQFTEVSPTEMPAAYRDLLVHTNHMTVTVEKQYKSLVDVQVLSTLVTQTHYARAIFLTRQSDGAAVLFGIPRVNFDYLDPQVRREIESQTAPLGRILINHNVLREIRLLNVWRVTSGKELNKVFGLTQPTITYGRTAVIDCNGQPAVELLEIVRPVAT
jgi:chorismate-pyruvate lyase